MGVFIAVIVVLVILIYFMTIMLRSVVSESNQKVNGYFLKNLEMYDTRYKDKVNALRRINVEYEDVSRELRNMRNEMISYKTSPFYAPRPVPRDIFIPTARYIDNDFFEEYKIAKDKLMSINKQEVIDNVIEKVPFTGNVELYETIQGILNKLNFEAIYDLCSSTKEDQLQIIKDSLDDKEQKLLLEYIETLEDIDEFEVLGFTDFLKHTAWKNDPHVFVSVAENEEDYSNEDRNIVCLVDQNICEGLKIVYQNKVYDYSIYKSRRKVGS